MTDVAAYRSRIDFRDLCVSGTAMRWSVCARFVPRMIRTTIDDASSFLFHLSKSLAGISAEIPRPEMVNVLERVLSKVSFKLDIG